MRSPIQDLFLFLKGMGMGAADVVPGVSGGTIALISGIYEELIETINKVDLAALKLLFQGKLKEFWTAINGKFLLVLFSGIGLSLLSLAKLMSFLLKNHPILLWSFFFGLVIASAWLIAKELRPFKLSYLLAIFIGAGIAYFITTISPSSASISKPYIFFCGSIAICAMILPGISGSFILLLLGAYSTVIGALGSITSNFKENITIIGIFIAGCILGLALFSRLLNWLFKTYREFTIALMTGFLIGSLNKIWPWQHITGFIIKHKGEKNEELLVTEYENVLPQNFDRISLRNDISILEYEPANPHLWAALGLCVLGFMTIFLLERIGSSK